MTTRDVLVIESGLGTAAPAVAALVAAGHRVHSCYEADPVSGGHCTGIASGRHCPLDEGMDVALLVRRGVQPRPTPFEAGVRCAIRAAVPVVEDGTDVLDPHAPWIARRITRDDDVVEACEDAADAGVAPLRDAIRARTAMLLSSNGLDPATLACRLDREGTTLDVHLTLPTTVGRGLEQALAVRVLDAVRSGDRTYGQVDVHVHAR